MPRPRSRLAHAALLVSTALAVALLDGCSAIFLQPPGTGPAPATPAEIAAKHPPAELHGDLDAMVSLHEAACPDPYMRVGRATVLATRDRLKAAITEPQTRIEFLPAVMELEACYQIDHMMMGVPGEDLLAAVEAGSLLVPFRATPAADGLRVVAVSEAETGLQPGETIVVLNGRPASEWVAAIGRLVPAEEARFQQARIEGSFRSLAFLAGARQPFEADVRGTDGSVRHATLAGVGRNARVNERQAAATATPVVNGIALVASKPYRCILLPGEGAPIAYIDFPTMDGTLAAQWSEFLDRSFAAMAEHHVAGLVVDIRRNGGGSSDLGEELIAHLTDHPYRMAAGVVWRKSEEGVESMSQRLRPMWRWLTPIAMPMFVGDYAKLKDGEDLVGNEEPASHPLRPPTFTGPAVLLIGEGTFSSAMMLADAARTYDLMVTIGEPTGGLPTSLGELGFHELPATKLRVPFCQKKFLRASGDEHDIGPVVPRVEVGSEPGRDAPLERAVAEIRSRAGG